MSKKVIVNISTRICSSSIVINYVWYKSDGNFQDLLEKVFKDKAKLKTMSGLIKIIMRQ